MRIKTIAMALSLVFILAGTTACSTTQKLQVSTMETTCFETYPEDAEVVHVEVARTLVNNYNMLYENADYIVTGRFVGSSSSVTKEYDGEFKKEIIVGQEAIETFLVSQTLKGKPSDSVISISRSYGYDKEDNQLVTLSELKPMTAKDEWVLFLKESPKEENTYYVLGDHTGQYLLDVVKNIDTVDSVDKERFQLYDEKSIPYEMYREVSKNLF